MSVEINGDNYLYQTEMFCRWYLCPNCEGVEIAYGFYYCLTCGEEIRWEGER